MGGRCPEVDQLARDHDWKEALNGRILYIFAIPAAAVALVIILIAVLTRLPLLAIFALPVAALTVWFMWQRSDDAVLKSIGARGLGQTEGQRVLNLVENLCLATGIDQPQVMVIDSPACNIAALGAREKTLVFTTGMLETLDLLEMEGVVAHALSKLSGDSMTYPTAALSARPAITNGQLKTAQQWGMDSSGPETFDIEGVALTKYPPGLRSALERMNGMATDVEGAEALGDAWFVPPLAEKSDLGRRIEVLWEL